MKNSICGADCLACTFEKDCLGCEKTGGKPFGKECLIAAYCLKDEKALSKFEERLICEFKSLDIKEMKNLTKLNALKGSFINLSYTLPSGETLKIWDDNKIYLGNQICKENSDRCYGIAADDKYLAVSEYKDFGKDAELIIFKRWN